jgi:hypothetical protein
MNPGTPLFYIAKAMPAFGLLCTMAGFVAAVTVTFTDERRRRIAEMLRDAIRLSKQTMSQASQEAEIDQAQFQRQIEMTEGSLKRLAMQPDACWQWLGVSIAAQFGIPEDAKRALLLEQASTGVKRMQRMDAIEAQDRRRA